MDDNDIYIDCSPVGESEQQILYTNRRSTYNPRKYFDKVTNRVGRFFKKLDNKTKNFGEETGDSVERAANRTNRAISNNINKQIIQINKAANDVDNAFKSSADSIARQWSNLEEQLKLEKPNTKGWNSIKKEMDKLEKEFDNIGEDKKGVASTNKEEARTTIPTSREPGARAPRPRAATWQPTAREQTAREPAMREPAMREPATREPAMREPEGFNGGKIVEGLRNKRGEKISLRNYAKVKGIQDLDVASKITGRNVSKISKSKEVKNSIDYINVFKSNKGNIWYRDYRRKKASNDIALGIFAGIISVALFNRAFNKLLEEKTLN